MTNYIGNKPSDVPLTASDIPDLPTSKITTGTFANSLISASSVSQHATSFDDNKIVNDLSTLGLRVHTQENLIASNTNSASFDVFQDSSGITNLTNTSRATEEYVASVITSVGRLDNSLHTDSISNGNDLSYAFDQDLTTETASFNNSGGMDITSDFGASGQLVSSVKIKRATGRSLLRNGSNVAQNQNLEYFASNDSSNYGSAIGTVASGTGNAGDETLTITYSGSTAYRYHKMHFPAVDSTSDKIVGEIEWHGTTTTANATGSFESNPITASSTSSMGAVITYQDNAGTNALNTDIILKLSADNGSNYSTATLTALPDFATGIKMAKVNDLSVTAGTQLKYKLEFANQSQGSKEARIRGVSLQY